jgi:hypothetical protein
MGFSSKQVQALRRQVEERHVRIRESHGRTLSYIEGWYAIAQANRIFGFDGWNRETVDSKCVLAREVRGAFTAVYTAKARITVQAEGITVIREGHGSGQAQGGSPGDVHDMALKAAETDATKRALATFGRPFGLELYRHGKATDRKQSQGAPSRFLGSIKDHQPTAAISQVDTTVPVRLGHTERGDTGPSVGEADGPPAALPSNTAPLRRPSRHYGRQRFHDTRQQNGALVREIERETTNAPLVPVQPDLLERTTIDKSALTFGEPKRLRDKGHLRFVGSQPCLVCGRQPADAHHLRFAQPRALGLKVSDEFTVPLCRGHHRAVHQTGNEAAWWEDLDINALEIARGLWEQSRGLNVGPGEKHVAHPEPEAAPSATTRSQP